MTGAIYPLTFVLPDKFIFEEAGAFTTATPMGAYICIMCGLWSGLIIGYVTEIFTSNAYSPVQDLAEACLMGAAPNIILGLALGYMSTVIPIFCLAITIYISFL